MLRSSLVAVALVALLAAPAFAQTTVEPWEQAVFGDESVKLSGNAVVDSYDPATGYDPKNPGTDGDVRSNVIVRLEGRATVRGDVTSGGDVRRSGGNTTITGTVTTLAPTVVHPTLAAWVTSKAATNDNASIGDDDQGNPVISGTTFELKSGHSITIPAGDYYFTAMTVKGTLETSGPARFFLDGKLTVQGTAKFNDGGNPEHCIVISAAGGAKDVLFQGQSESRCFVLAMRTEIQMTVNAELYGALTAKSVEIKGNAQLHYPQGGPTLDVPADTSDPTKQFGTPSGGGGDGAPGGGS